MRCGKERITRTQTGTYNSQAVVSLLFQPIQAAAGVDHCLPAGIQSPANIGGHGIIGPADLGRHPNVVIRHAQPQHGNVQKIQHAAQAGISKRV